ncbi:hypothetical protein [Natrinema pallidum]|uniref:Uncharacterized protein n=1 Tax=Natrinema pallidum TaxID=69527 RepID=A0A4P9TGS9_9EURY|nr:hypothetical protein [Natrinema pallidum]QCW03325.1 hypothetical protein FGF80_08770 [Natrinema pallidum]
MPGKDDINRRNVLKSSAVIGFGGISLTGSATAQDEESKESELGENFDAEDYVKTEKYIYRRIQTAETDMLLRLNLKKGEAVFAEIESTMAKQDITASSKDENLREKTRSMTGVEIATAQSADAESGAVDPVDIAEATRGVDVASSSVIFKQVDVAEQHLGSCGTIAYDDHKYYHIAMELGDYDLDDLGHNLGYSVVCSALFTLVGSKSKTIKKILDTISDSNLIDGIPGTICGFIFGDVLDDIFSGGDGTVGFWDRETGGTISVSKLAFGGSSEYDPDPEDLRDNGPEEQFTGVHTELFR